MALEKENDRTTQFNTFSLLSNEVKNGSRCWVWLPRGFLIIKLDTAVWTARPCRNSTSFSLRVEEETGIFKAFARNLMESFYRQRCLLTPRAPSKIVWLAWLLKSRAGDQQNISACKWHLGQNARAQCHERDWKTLWHPLTKLLSKNASIKCQKRCWKAASWRTPSFPSYPVHFSSTEVNFEVLTFCPGITWESNNCSASPCPYEMLVC